ncbi:hypothetical protein FB451DRAFT_1258624, partial [Mycena latifolia]
MENVAESHIDSVTSVKETLERVLLGLANLALLAAPAATCYLITTVMPSTAAATIGCLVSLLLALFVGAVSSACGGTDPEIEAVSFMLTVHFCAARLPFVIPSQQVLSVMWTVPQTVLYWNAYLRQMNLYHRQCDMSAIQDYFGIFSAKDRGIGQGGLYGEGGGRGGPGQAGTRRRHASHYSSGPR